MSFVFFWFLFSILAGIFASRRDRSGVWFFIIALLLSPPVSFLWATFSPGGKICPYCASRIRNAARVCKFCGRE